MSLWRPLSPPYNRITLIWIKKAPTVTSAPSAVTGWPLGAYRVMRSNSGRLKRRQQLNCSLDSSSTDGSARYSSVWLDHKKSHRQMSMGSIFIQYFIQWHFHRKEFISGQVYCESNSKVLSPHLIIYFSYCQQIPLSHPNQQWMYPNKYWVCIQSLI